MLLQKKRKKKYRTVCSVSSRNCMKKSWIVVNVRNFIWKSRKPTLATIAKTNKYKSISNVLFLISYFHCSIFGRAFFSFSCKNVSQFLKLIHLNIENYFILHIFLIFFCRKLISFNYKITSNYTSKMCWIQYIQF